MKMANDELPDFDQLWDYDQPSETEELFRALLPQTQKSGNRAYRAELLTQIARTLGLQQKFEEAHNLLDEAESMLTGDMNSPRIRYLLERGRVFNSSGSPDLARPLFVEAWEQARQAGEDSYAVDAAHMVAIVAQDEEALTWNLRALQFAETSSEERARKWLGSLYNNIGWTYHDMGQHDRALDIFDRALEFREKEGKPKPIHIARWCIARTLRSLGRVKDALEIQQVLLKGTETSNDEDGYVYEELGECLILLERENEAKSYFARSYALLSQDPWLARNEPERLQRLQEMSS
jgi:tetratricopeptide (TPR) repeat protein